MSKDEVIEKIRKLLRMKRGGTPAEVATALALAAELARKHGVDLGAVDPDVESSEVITHVEDVLKCRLPLEAKLAAAILVNFFNVAVVFAAAMDWKEIRRVKTVRFVGTNWDIEVARYIFVFLQGHFRRAWSKRENRRIRNREAFLNGMYRGLVIKLREEREAAVSGNEAALVLIGKAVAKRNDYVQKHWETKDQSLTPDNSNAASARWAGYVAGRNTEIRRGVNGASAQRKQLAAPCGSLAQGELVL